MVYTHDAPFDGGMLKVDAIHHLHYEQYGAKDGLLVIYLHGGPGGQTEHANTKYFNPSKYRVVLFDQRGAGRSLPSGETAENTTHHLLRDIERIREHLGISKWSMVFGGSWGSTLGLLYCQAYPDKVCSLVVRGVFTATDTEMRFSRGPDGAAQLFPDRYEAFINFLPPGARQQPYVAYHHRLMSPDHKVALAAATAWNRWGIALSSVQPGPDAYASLADARYNLTHAKLESHYFTNQAWLSPGQILDDANMKKMKHLPGAIVQGRYDILTPPKTAWELHKKWTKAALYFVDAAGHKATEPGIEAKLVEVCDELIETLEASV